MNPVARTAATALAMLFCSGAAYAADGIRVHLVPLQKGSLPISVTTYGTVAPPHNARVTLSAPVAVRVSRVEVREGERVDKGASLARLLPSPETRLAYQQAETALMVARHLLARSRQLVASHLETTAQLARDEKAEADAKAALETLKQEGANGPRTLKAPFDAVVMRIAASSGSFVVQGAPLITLARPAGLVFKTGVVPAEAAQIKNGDTATITPFSGSGTFRGKVVLRGSVVSPGSGLVPIEISLPDSTLLAGEMGKVVIDTGVKQGYIVPHEAVLLDTSGQTYIVQSVNDVAKQIPVTMLTSRGDQDLVEGKLVDGAPVVGTGNYQLDNGSKILASDERSSSSGHGNAQGGQGS
jgi:membrane fusion protein (multidrug efflux system)